MQSAIYDTSYSKFKKSYNTAARKTSQDKTAVSHVYIHKVNQQECKSTCQNHGPMCVTSCYNFYKAVNYSAETENC